MRVQKTPGKKPAKARGSRAEIGRLKVTLRNIRPPIWRRLEVPTDLTFASLHDILQVAFGWTDSHLHQFRAGPMTIGITEDDPDNESTWGFVDDFADVFGELRDEKELALDPIVTTYDRLTYEYDFGDGWEHGIVVEALAPPEEGVRYPRCLTGKRSGPPEDCGGPWGYRDLSAAIAEPKNKRHKSMTVWAGRHFDPEYFSVEETNARLLALRKRKRWK